MCLIIHKPAGLPIAHDLLEAALAFNQDGFGLMGFTPTGRFILRREPTIALHELLETERRYREAELVLHLRLRTRGDAEEHNAHPFRVTAQAWLMHNGTLRLPIRLAGRSDTWHFVQDVLRPLAQRRSGVLFDNAFLKLLEMALRPENKVVLLDAASQRIEILNRAHGAELDGLWLSSTRWIDHRRLPLSHAPQPQERTYAATDVHFI